VRPWHAPAPFSAIRASIHDINAISRLYRLAGNTGQPAASYRDVLHKTQNPVQRGHESSGDRRKPGQLSHERPVLTLGGGRGPAAVFSHAGAVCRFAHSRHDG